MDTLRSLLENSTVIHAEESKWGDFKLCFSNGVTLEVFAGIDRNHTTDSHPYGIKQLNNSMFDQRKERLKGKWTTQKN